MSIDHDIRRLFGGIDHNVVRTFRNRPLLPRLDPDLREAMRKQRERSSAIARETVRAVHEQYERVYGKAKEQAVSEKQRGAGFLALSQAPLPTTVLATSDGATAAIDPALDTESMCRDRLDCDVRDCGGCLDE